MKERREKKKKKKEACRQLGEGSGGKGGVEMVGYTAHYTMGVPGCADLVGLPSCSFCKCTKKKEKGQRIADRDTSHASQPPWGVSLPPRVAVQTAARAQSTSVKCFEWRKGKRRRKRKINLLPPMCTLACHRHPHSTSST